MKHSLVRLSLLFGAVVILGVVVNGQTAKSYRAEVPFDFQAAGQSYTAGQYSVSSIGNSTGPVTLLDRKSGKMRIMGLSNGRDDDSVNGKLIFMRVGEHYTLLRIETPQFELKIRPAKDEGRLAKKSTVQKEVAVRLN